MIFTAAFTLALAAAPPAYANDVLNHAGAACVRALAVQGFDGEAKHIPVHNSDAAFVIGNDQTMLRVTRNGIDELVVVDNRAAGLGLAVSAVPVVRVSRGHEIRGSRVNARRDGMLVHVVDPATTRWRRDRNYVIPIETRPGRVYATRELLAAPGSLATHQILFGMPSGGLRPLETDFQRVIRESLDQDAHLERIGSITIGNQSDLLGQMSTVDAWYGLYARDHDWDEDQRAADLADLEHLLANQRVRLSLVRIGERAEVAHFEARGQFTRDFASFDGPRAAYVMLRESGAPREDRGPRPQANPAAKLIRVELPEPRWQPLDSPASSAAVHTGGSK